MRFMLTAMPGEQPGATASPVRNLPGASMQPNPDLTLATGALWPAFALQQWVHLQQMQWDAAIAWQRSFTELQQDWFNRWACRYAGAARLAD